MNVVVSDAGALLWMTHTLLREHGWVAQGLEGDPLCLHRLESFAGNVNLLPAQCYQLPKLGQKDTDVHVRALLVGNNLFAHFVVLDKSVRLSLKVSEFVKPRTDQRDEVPGRVMYTDKWRCNLEILRWRLDRNLFPEFSSNASVVTSDAELSRLPEPLLARIGGLLNIQDFCRLTQTNKYLHQLQGSSELWQQFLLRDYPALQAGRDPKALYISSWTYLKRMEAWSQQDRERRLHEYRLRHQRWHVGGRLLTPPLHLPLPPPFLPLGVDPWSLRLPHRPGLLGVEDLTTLHDPFALDLDPPLYPYFY